MQISETLIATLRCPATQQAMTLAGAEQLDSINAAIADDMIIEGEQATFSGKLEGALVTSDKIRCYPIDDGYPVILVARQLRHKNHDPL